MQKNTKITKFKSQLTFTDKKPKLKAFSYPEEKIVPAKPKVVQAIKPAQQVKPAAVQKPVEEPKAAKTVSGADDLAAEIAQLVGDVDNG